MFALEEKNPAGDACEIEKGNGDVRDYNIRTAAAVLYDTSTLVLVVRTPVPSLSFQVQHTMVPGIAGRVDMLTSPVAAARAAVATGAWVEHMYLIHMWKCGSSSFIFTHPPEDEKRRKRKAYLVPGAVYASTQQTIQIRGTGVCLARKNSS